MDDWFYYDVTHGLHTFCNPISEDGVEELIRVLDPGPGLRVLDIASGHGELLLRLAARGASGVGVDLSPFGHARAVAALESRGGDLDVEFVHGAGEAYEPDAPFDVAMCIGASWIWKGWRGTMEALTAFVRPGGRVVLGEPYWIEEPAPRYLELEKLKADEFPTFGAYFEGALERGLTPVWMRRSTSEDWDRYEMLQTAAFDRFLQAHPDHPDADAIRARLGASKEAYVKWGKDCLGFAIWVFRVP